MLKILIILGTTLSPAIGQAAEKFTATNTYVTESRAWPTGEKAGYWMGKFTGVSQVTAGPINTMAVECHGAGFWGASSLEVDGICIHGDGDDTFILRFETNSPANTWQILTGTGKYLGLTGSGTATTEKLPGNRRISKLEGEVILGE